MNLRAGQAVPCRYAHDPLVLSTLAAALFWTRGAHAEQVILADVTYTHSAETTEDSHYRVDPPAEPANWVEPIDYRAGSVHILVDVKTKPDGDAPTKFQICFEATAAACTDQSPTYTKPGKVEWTSQFADFWYGGEVDWSRGVRRIALILKDDKNGKPAGDPLYMPSDVRVELALLSPGETYRPPSGATGGAGAGGASAGAGGAAGDASGAAAGAGAGSGGAVAATVAGSDGAGAGGRSAGGASGSAVSGAGAGGAAGVAGAASGSQPSAAGSAGGVADRVAGASGAVSASQEAALAEFPRKSSGCSALGPGSQAPRSTWLWACVLLVGVVVLWRRQC